MEMGRALSKRCGRPLCGLITAVLLWAGCTSSAHAADFQSMSVVRPAISCEQLAKADVSKAVGSAVTISSATVMTTEKGPYCAVKGTIAPAIGFEVDLPMEHWTQRFVLGGCGGMCGHISIGVKNSGSCTAGLNGEFAVAADNMGHSEGTGGPGGGNSFGADPDARIDFAYRSNHETTLVSKALIKTFYGQPQKYSYFVGCSDGGREALAEAQRFPEDFDGIAAGAPVLLISLHNSFFHGWESIANKDADGSPVLVSSRSSIIRNAILAHCPTLSGVQDGLLEDPVGSCKFDPTWVQCKAGETDTSKCLTAAETAVVYKLYDGASDAQGRHFTFNGYSTASELMEWHLPATTAKAAGGGMPGMSNVQDLLMPTVLTDEEAAKFDYNEEWFQRVNELGAPLYNAGNTNLRLFEARGGKLIVWHGLADDSVPPAMSVAYYQGVEKEMGEKLTDSFMRLFLVPGAGHCATGGSGFTQIDVLSPLMAWTEMKKAPNEIIVGRTADQGQPKQAVGGGQGGPGQGAPGGQAQGQGRQGGGGPNWSKPYLEPNSPTLATRPVYPFPYIAKYKGTGNPLDAANYQPTRVPEALPIVFDTEALKLIGPNNQKFYHVVNGKLVEEKK